MEKRIGRGTITAECRSDGSSVASDLFANYPCRLHLTSRPNNELKTKVNDYNNNENDESKTTSKALTCYVLGYGGGLISGDTISLHINVKTNASLVVTSQSTSKAFKAIPGRDATLVKTVGNVGKGGLLFLVPQPMQCFGGSKLEQETHIVLDGGRESANIDHDHDEDDIGIESDQDPSLLLVDWYTGGRKNLDGGLWNMESFHTTTTVSYSKQSLFPSSSSSDDEEEDNDNDDDNDDDSNNKNMHDNHELVFRDATRLSGGNDLLRHMKHFGIVCMVVLIGPRVQKVSDLFRNKFSSRHVYDDDHFTNTEEKSKSNNKSNNTKEGTSRGLNQNRGEGLNDTNEGLLVSCGTFDTIPGSSSSESSGGVVVRLAADTLEIAATFLSKHIGTLDGQLDDDPFLEILSSKQCIVSVGQQHDKNESKSAPNHATTKQRVPMGLLKNSFQKRSQAMEQTRHFSKSNNNISPLILYQLVDSCVPSGGFAHSNTLEAAHQLHILTCINSSWRVSLREHCFDVLLQTFTATIPFLVETCHLFRSFYHHHDGVEEEGEEEKEGGSSPSSHQQQQRNMSTGKLLTPPPETILKKFESLEKELRATMNSHVACRASTTQGSGMLRAFSAAFPDIAPVLKILRRRILRMTPILNASQTDCYGHAATCFGAVCGLLNIDKETCTSMFLYTTARDMVNAAVRMNLIGPLEGGCVTNELCNGVNGLIELHLQDLINCCNDPDENDGNKISHTVRCGSHAHQISPLVEVLSNAHDRLYTRLFNS